MYARALYERVCLREYVGECSADPIVFGAQQVSEISLEQGLPDVASPTQKTITCSSACTTTNTTTLILH